MYWSHNGANPGGREVLCTPHPLATAASHNAPASWGGQWPSIGGRVLFCRASTAICNMGVVGEGRRTTTSAPHTGARKRPPLPLPTPHPPILLGFTRVRGSTGTAGTGSDKGTYLRVAVSAKRLLAVNQLPQYDTKRVLPTGSHQVCVNAWGGGRVRWAAEQRVNIRKTPRFDGATATPSRGGGGRGGGPG
jgi:hypothetical protein